MINILRSFGIKNIGLSFSIRRGDFLFFFGIDLIWMLLNDHDKIIEGASTDVEMIRVSIINHDKLYTEIFYKMQHYKVIPLNIGENLHTTFCLQTCHLFEKKTTILYDSNLYSVGFKQKRILLSFLLNIPIV